MVWLTAFLCFLAMSTGLGQTTENSANFLQAPGEYSLPYTLKTNIAKFYPFSEKTDSLMPRWSIPVEIPLKQKFPFYFQLYDTIFPNAYGMVAFGAGYEQLPQSLPTTNKIKLVAPYWAHTEMNSCMVSNGSVSRGDIFVRETSSETDLRRANEDVKSHFPGLRPKFTPKSAIIMTVYEVRMPQWDCNAPLQTFQMILATDGQRSFATFIYHQMGPMNDCDDPPSAGIDAGDGVRGHYLGVLDDFLTRRLLMGSNLSPAVPGKFMFRIDGDDGPTCNGEPIRTSPRHGSLLGGTKVSIEGICVDQPANTQVYCKFDGARVAGIAKTDDKVECVSPMGVKSGRVTLEVSTDGGSTYQSSPSFSYEHSVSDVIFVNEKAINMQNSDGADTHTIELKWDRELLPVGDVAIQLLAWGYRPTGESELTNDVTFVENWKKGDHFGAVLIPLSNTKLLTRHVNNGSAFIPARSMFLAIPQDMILEAGAYRIIPWVMSDSSAEKGGDLTSEAMYSHILPLPFLSHFFEAYLPNENRPTAIRVNHAPYIEKGLEDYRENFGCYARLSSKVTFEKALETTAQKRADSSHGYLQVYRFAREVCKEYNKNHLRMEGRVDLLSKMGCHAPALAVTEVVDRASVAPCPANLAQASRDSARYMVDRSCSRNVLTTSNCLWNHQADHCVLSAANTQGVASQCCFSGQGTLINAGQNIAGGRRQYIPFGVNQQLNLTTREWKHLDWTNSIYAAVESSIQKTATGLCCFVTKNINGETACSDLFKSFKGEGAHSYISPVPAILEELYFHLIGHIDPVVIGHAHSLKKFKAFNGLKQVVTLNFALYQNYQLDFIMMVDNCHLTSKEGADSAIRLPIIKTGGCVTEVAKDTTTLTFNGTTQQVEFIAVKLGEDSDVLYVHCQVSVCRNKGCQRGCTPDCNDTYVGGASNRRMPFDNIKVMLQKDYTGTLVSGSNV